MVTGSSVVLDAREQTSLVLVQAQMCLHHMQEQTLLFYQVSTFELPFTIFDK